MAMKAYSKKCSQLLRHNMLVICFLWLSFPCFGIDAFFTSAWSTVGGPEDITHNVPLNTSAHNGLSQASSRASRAAWDIDNVWSIQGSVIAGKFNYGIAGSGFSCMWHFDYLPVGTKISFAFTSDQISSSGWAQIEYKLFEGNNMLNLIPSPRLGLLGPYEVHDKAFGFILSGVCQGGSVFPELGLYNCKLRSWPVTKDMLVPGFEYKLDNNTVNLWVTVGGFRFRLADGQVEKNGRYVGACIYGRAENAADAINNGDGFLHLNVGLDQNLNEQVADAYYYDSASDVLQVVRYSDSSQFREDAKDGKLANNENLGKVIYPTKASSKAPPQDDIAKYFAAQPIISRANLSFMLQSASTTNLSKGVTLSPWLELQSRKLGSNSWEFIAIASSNIGRNGPQKLDSELS